MKKLGLILLFGILFFNSLSFISGALVNTTMLNDTFESGNLNLWTDNGATDWDLSNTQAVSPTNSVECSSDDNDLLSDDLDMSDASNIFISFSYWVNAIDANDDVILYYWDGANYDSILELGTQTAGQWNSFSVNISDSQYFDNGFHIYIEGSSIDAGENLWIDNVLIKKETNINNAPNISNITASHSTIKGGNTITIYANTTTHGVNDTEQATLYLYCDTTNTPTAANTDCTGGTTSSNYAYNLTCTFATPTTTATNIEYCRVYDGTSYSSTVPNVTYTTDSTSPTTSITSVAYDASPSYFDNVNDGKTDIIISGEANMLCRWSSSDVVYSSMTNDCVISGTTANCSANDIASQGFYTRYVSCRDSLGNEQNTTQNLDIQFYLDYTAPTTTDNSNINVQTPYYIVTLTESDNVDSDPTTYYCSSTTPLCNPTTLIDNGGTVNFTTRGANYLRYYSIDDAGNSQAIQNKTININQLPIFSSALDNATTIKGGWKVNLTTNSSDYDLGQTLNLFVCSSLGATSSGCTGTEYCSSSGTSNLSCILTSETDSASHTWYAYLFDDLNEAATNNPLTGEFTTDSASPSITINSPLNITYSQDSITLTIVVNEALSWAGYSINGNFNVTLTNTSLYEYTGTNNSISSGSYNITFYANDTYGNLASSVRHFTIDTTAQDTTPPTITVWSPANNTYYTSSSLVLNITADENISWAGYRNDSGLFVNLDNVSLTNWNSTIIISEGSHSIIFYANDTSSNKNQGNKTVTFYMDTTNPGIESFSCTNPANNSENVNCTAILNDTVGLSYAIISYNATGSWQNSSNLILSGTSYSVSYIIGSANTSIGNFDAEIYVYDLAARKSNSSYRLNITDDTFPEIYNLSYTPNTTNDLDPGVLVNISADVIEDYHIGSVVLKYKNISDSDWTSITMSNTTVTNYNASFSPQNVTYQFYISANDTQGNTNVSLNTTLIIANETGFYNSTDIPDIKSFTISQEIGNNTLGIISLNNTGDEGLNFTITISPGSLTGRFNINGTGNETMIYEISKNNGTNLTFYVNTTSLPVALYSYNITISSDAGISTYQKQIYIQTAEGPYLTVSITKYSSTVTKGQTNVELIATVKNQGTQDATNTILVWSLPSVFTLTSGSLSRNLGNLPIGISSTNTITVSVSSDSADEIVNITADATATGDLNASDYKSVTIGSPITITNTVTISGGGGGGGGGKASESVLYNKESEVVRGKQNSFTIDIYNKYLNSELKNLKIELTGFPSQYISVYPSQILSVKYKETKSFTVELLTPSYKEYEENDLKAVITGELIQGNTSKSYTETQFIKMTIQEISREDATNTLTDAEKAIEEMKLAGFSTDLAEISYSEAQDWLNNKKRNKNSYDISVEIIKTKDTAFESDDLLRRLIEAMQNPKKSNLIVGNAIRNLGDYEKEKTLSEMITGKTIFATLSTQDILGLAIAAFERGDYYSALERAKETRNMLILERKGNFFLFIYLYWHFLLLATVLMSTTGIITYRKYQKSSISNRIADLDKKEENIRHLISEDQRKYFSGKSSAGEYHRVMNQHQNELANIRKSINTLGNTRIKLLQPEQVKEDLNKEKTEVESKIKKAQLQYYKDKSISETEYKTQFDSLNERIAEVEDERTTLDFMKKSPKKGFFEKIKSLFKLKKPEKIKIIKLSELNNHIKNKEARKKQNLIDENEAKENREKIQKMLGEKK